MTMKHRGAAVLLVAALSASSLAAQATNQSAAEPKGHSGLGFGLKAGIGFSPTQFVVGAQYSLGKGLGIFRVVPNVHFGFGDVTSFDFNVDFLARVIAKDAGFGFYLGAAPTYTTADSDSDFGFTVVAGTQVPLIKNHATNIEARFGTSGAPDLRILAAIVF
jgi:opacity protein-like surface antigen